MALLMTGSAAAQTSPWYIGASQTFTHESNLYRRGDGVATPAGTSRSDLVSSTALLAGFDQPISRQRAFANATLRASQYKNNDDLDNEGYSLRAGLDWETVNRLSGTLSLNSSRDLARFESGDSNAVVTQRNVVRNNSLSASARLGVVTTYTAEASLEHRTLDYSAEAYAPNENRQTTGTLGLRWWPSGKNYFGVGLRYTDGEYPRFEDLGGGAFRADSYTRTGLDLSGELDVGGASRVVTRVTLGRTTYDEATQRDLSGVTGFVAFIWSPGPKLRLETRLSRDTGQDSFYSDSPLIAGTVDTSRVTNRLGLRANYEATAKIKLTAGLSYASRDLVRSLPAGAQIPGDATGRDNTTEFSLGGTWEPTRSLVFGCDLGLEKRSASGDLSLPYSANRFGCYGQVFLR
ncbi:MAG: hypothetical protein IV093_22110 [Rubrivivax sp.]|nr:hypothetical protein [Rubrivivax sp.]